MPKQVGDQNTTPELRDAICMMAAQGFSTGVIAGFSNVSPRTIRRIITNYRVRGHNQDSPRSGRPQKLNDRSIRHLNWTVEKNRRQSLADLTNTVNAASPAPVSPRTVSRAIKEKLNMASRIARKKPFLKKKHRLQRTEWAKDAVTWGIEEWKRVIWTDESSVELGKNTRVCRVWRHPGEAFDEKCLVPTFKSGRTSIMVWSCIAYDKKGPLHFLLTGRGNGAGYVELVMAGPLWDVYSELYNERGVARVMEDGAPMHRSHLAKEFRQAHLMETIPHPAQSPDMNPIEHVWKVLKEQVNKRPKMPKNADELKVALVEEWEKIDIGFINHLIEGMPDHVEALRRAKGGSTSY